MRLTSANAPRIRGRVKLINNKLKIKQMVNFRIQRDSRAKPRKARIEKYTEQKGIFSHDTSISKGRLDLAKGPRREG